MPSGAPRKPRALKLLEGTLRPDRDRPEPEFPETEDAEAPSWLNDGPATDEWNRLLPMLEDTGVMTEADISALAHLCNLHGKIVKVWMADDTPSAAHLARFAAMQGRFGLTPADRGNVRPSKRADPEDKFKALMGAG